MGAPGTFTFLFTDIEGSTARWEADGAAMSEDLDRHDSLMRRVVGAHAGEVFKHTGDGLCATFPAPGPALRAALEAQRELALADWGGRPPLRVRMAVHTGAAERRESDFFGPALNRVARLMGIAHGGQVLASLAAAEIARDEVGRGAGLVDMGEHHLRGLAKAERVFQLQHPELPVEFPPLRSGESTRHNLPAQLSPFLGRERELAEIARLLADARLVTITGVGGAGKTRLALEAAERSLGLFPGGVFLTELAPISDAALLPAALASALGLAGGTTDVVCEHLGPRPALLVLDNCEHVVDATARLGKTVLGRCAGVRILATSREPLGLPGEVVWPTPPLSEDDALLLLCDRAQAADARVRPAASNRDDLAEICRRLDGLPLALELAAPRLSVLSPADLAARLSDRFRLLTGGPRTLPRHQTLRAALDWGYELLDENEQDVLAALSVFPTSFEARAAEAVGVRAGRDGWEVLDLLSHLIGKSWVAIEEGRAETRYRLAESVRQYATEKLSVRADATGPPRRHRDFFAALAAQHGRSFLSWPGGWMARLEIEHDNLRAAIEWSFAQGEADVALRLAADSAIHCMWDGHATEARLWLERGLAACVDPSLRGYGLTYLGGVLWFQGELDRTERVCEEAQSAALATGDEESAAGAAFLIGQCAVQQGKPDRARTMLTAAAVKFEAAGLLGGVAYCEQNLGWIDFAGGDRPSAIRRLERAVDLFRRQGNGDETETTILSGLAALIAAEGDAERALGLAEEALAIARRMNLSLGLVVALTRMAEVALLAGDPPRAEEALRESLALLADTRAVVWVAETLEAAAVLQEVVGNPHAAARIFAAAQSIDESTGETSPVRPLQERVDASRARLFAALGPESVGAEASVGAKMTAAEAIAYAAGQLAGQPDGITRAIHS